MRNRILSFGALLAVVFTAPVALGDEMPYMGQTAVFAYDACPRSWMPTDGRMLQIFEYHELFALLGTRYGGDGSRSFAIPNMSAPSTKHGALVSCISTNGRFPSRQ